MLNAGAEPSIDRDRLRDQAEQLDRTIKRLSAIRDGLRHAAECGAPNHLQCPSFQRLMKIAARSVAKGHHPGPG
ncbi:mutant efflux regulatory protein conferring antibiotic resistance [compost metagenome]